MSSEDSRKLAFSSGLSLGRPSAVPEGSEPPSELLVLRLGVTEFTRGGRAGSFEVTAEDAMRILAEASGRGRDVVVDYDHASVRGRDAPAAGWLTGLRLAADGIRADVSWTPRAAAMLSAREAEAIQAGLWREADRAYATMPEDEREAIFAYTCRDLYSLNSTLFGIYRRNVLGQQVDYSLSDAQLGEIELLRRALDRLPRFRGTVYRCMSLDTVEHRDDFVKRWTEMQDAMTGFMSTTYRRKNARLYMKKGKPTIIFLVKNSTRGTYIGHRSGATWRRGGWSSG